MINIRKVRKTKTVSLPPYGRVPIKDATDDVTFVLEKEHVIHGHKDAPSACAIALAIRDNAILFKEGLVLGAWVYKTYTLVAINKNSKVQARRYAHEERTRKGINGFDKSSAASLKPGDVVVLVAPTGRKRLGVSNGTSHPGNYKAKSPRPKNTCARKRGVFVDPFHAKQAQREAGKEASVTQ